MPKAKLIETAADLVYRQGWNATGINQILGESKVPKGSFYYYFHSKEELGIAIVRFHGASFETAYQETLLNPALSGMDAIEGFFKGRIEHYRSNGCRWGCPVGSFSSEVADTTERIADACRAVLLRFAGVLGEAVTRGQADRSIPTAQPAARVALQLLSVWQGSLLLMKATKSEQPLLGVLDVVQYCLNALM